jgi:5-formyltetrahydrofolate cyclo-ligase
MGDIPQLDQRKKAQRAMVRERLAAVAPKDRHDKSIRVCRRVEELDAFRHATTVMMYMPLPTEVDVTPLAIRCFQMGATVCVPKVNWERKDMSAVEVVRFEDQEMELDEHGIRVPRGGRMVLPTLIDLIIIPGIAFDAQGNRLGRGRGYYDRFLAKIGRAVPKIGVCFDEQIVDEVPTGPGDMKVDLVVSDRRCSRAGRPSVK